MASPSTSKSLSISAIFDLNGTPIPVNTGNLLASPRSFVFVLSQPINLGDGLQFIDWLNQKIGIPLTSEEVTDVINSIPDAPVLVTIKNILENILHLQVIIQAVKIDTGNKNYFFAITLQEPSPVPLFAGLSFDSVGIAVGFGGGSASP
jgi:hypothetical protein